MMLNHWACPLIRLNPYLMNGFSHHNQLDESTFIFRGIRSEFRFSYKFLMKILFANRIVTDGTPHSVALHLWLYCLPMSHKKDARLKLVNFSRTQYEDSLSIKSHGTSDLTYKRKD